MEDSGEKDSLWCSACKRSFASAQAMASHKNNSAEHRKKVAAIAKAEAAAKRAAKAAGTNGANKAPAKPKPSACEFDYPGDRSEDEKVPTKAATANKETTVSNGTSNGTNETTVSHATSNGTYDVSVCFKVGAIVEVSPSSGSVGPHIARAYLVSHLLSCPLRRSTKKGSGVRPGSARSKKRMGERPSESGI